MSQYLIKIISNIIFQKLHFFFFLSFFALFFPQSILSLFINNDRGSWDKSFAIIVAAEQVPVVHFNNQCKNITTIEAEMAIICR